MNVDLCSKCGLRHSAQECPPSATSPTSCSSFIDTIQPWTMEHLKAYPKAALEILNKRIEEANAAALASHTGEAEPVARTVTSEEDEVLRSAILSSSEIIAHGRLATPPAATPAAPGEVTALMKFYGVDSVEALIAAQSHHIEKLQSKLPPVPSLASQRIREG